MVRDREAKHMRPPTGGDSQKHRMRKSVATRSVRQAQRTEDVLARPWGLFELMFRDFR